MECACQSRTLSVIRTEEPEDSASIQAHAKNNKVIVDYKLDIDYTPEESDPNDEPVAEEEEKENSNAQFVIMELPN